MSIRGVLFDLDLTLVDSYAAEPLRRRRRWRDVYTMIPRLLPYEGIPLLLSEISRSGFVTGVVTSAPKSYAERVIGHWGWSLDTIVGYHDTRAHKPNPEPIIKALSLLHLRGDEAVYVGDDPKDVLAARAAGVGSIAALWGSLDRAALVASKPDYVTSTVQDLRGYLCSRKA